MYVKLNVSSDKEFAFKSLVSLLDDLVQDWKELREAFELKLNLLVLSYLVHMIVMLSFGQDALIPVVLANRPIEGEGMFGRIRRMYNDFAPSETLRTLMRLFLCCGVTFQDSKFIFIFEDDESFNTTTVAQMKRVIQSLAYELHRLMKHFKVTEIKLEGSTYTYNM